MDWDGLTSSVLGALGDSFTYFYGSGGSVPDLKIPIIKGVDVIDENGQIIDRVTSATILRSAIAHSPRQGDFMVATIGTTRYDVQRILSDDGYAVRVSVT